MKHKYRLYLTLALLTMAILSALILYRILG
jgi:hypothetical protein